LASVIPNNFRILKYSGINKTIYPFMKSVKKIEGISKAAKRASVTLDDPKVLEIKTSLYKENILEIKMRKIKTIED
jgi:hypothetical protein